MERQSIPPRPRRRAAVLSFSAALAVLALAVSMWLRSTTQVRPQAWTYTQLVMGSGADTIRRVQIDGENLELELQGGQRASVVVSNGQSQHAVIAALASKGIQVDFVGHDGFADKARGVGLPLFALLALSAAGYTVYRKKQMAHVQHIRPKSASGVSFADVAGVDEAKSSLLETIAFLRSPGQFGRLGGRAPRGILLEGPPGTGKTLLARAAAHEAAVPFLTASGSGFQEMFAGVGAARVRALFAKARKLAPCIIFLDEIDALGKKRGRSDDSASADADQMLNQLLIEMDGFDQTVGIVVLASTNRADVLDSALLRPGRFDRQINVGLPDTKGRSAILQVHARKVALAKSVDLPRVARTTGGYSGADLAQLLNEAALLAARDGADAIDDTHIERARDRVTMGEERHGVIMDEGERYATAVHEAGHVAVGLASVHGDPIHKVSILPRGRALGVTQAIPERDRLMYRREFLEDRIAMLLGGRAAEQVILGTMTAGASDDIERAVSLSRRMVAELGMSSLGPIHRGDDPALRSPASLDRIELETNRIMRAQLDRACVIVAERRVGIERLVSQLLESETLNGTEIRACFDGALAEEPLCQSA